MPYSRNRYDFVVDSSFQPFSMQEMLVPFTAYKDAFEKSEAAYDELNQKAGDFSYLASTLPEGSKARAIYEGYANDLKAQAEDFSKNGLSMGNRRALLGLKRRYSGEIGRLEKADAAMQEEKKLRRTMNAKDSSMLYAQDNLSVDDFLDGATPNLYNVSGDDLYKRGAQAAASASSRIYDNTQVSNLTKYYQEMTQRVGYRPELLAEFRQRLGAIPELQMAVDDILQEKGVNGNLSGANYERARQSVINGIIDGAVYKEARDVKQNLGVLTAAQAADDARANRSLALSAAASNMKWDRKTGSWVFDEEAAKKKQEYTLNNPAIDPDKWEAKPNGKGGVTYVRKEQPKEKEEKHTPMPDMTIDEEGNEYKLSSSKDNGLGKYVDYAEVLSDPRFSESMTKRADVGFDDCYDYFIGTMKGKAVLHRKWNANKYATKMKNLGGGSPATPSPIDPSKTNDLPTQK